MARAFLDDRSDPVERALRGFAAAHGDIVDLVDDPLYVRARERDPRRAVGLVSGGGSGHEPLHVGMVGRGMLDAAAPGRVFASPHNRQIYQASRAVAGPGGVLHIVKNYTGDRINFGIAAERLTADGVPVARVLVDDDIATGGTGTGTGRRGTGATVIVEKILGAAADEGMRLADLADLGAAVAGHSRSIAVASAAQTSLSDGEAAFDIPPGELEYGVGIHGERARRSIPRPDLGELVERMTADLDAALPSGDRILLLVGGLGATTALELYGAAADAAEALARHGRTAAASLVGTYTPALDMHGFCITVTVLRHPEWLRWWTAQAWTAAIRTHAAPGEDRSRQC